MSAYIAVTTTQVLKPGDRRRCAAHRKHAMVMDVIRIKVQSRWLVAANATTWDTQQRTIPMLAARASVGNLRKKPSALSRLGMTVP